MSWTNLTTIWENRSKIWEGLKNNVFRKDHVEALAEERLKICRSNTCDYYDPEGKSEKAFVKGSESCAACGCKLEWKVRSLSSDCGLTDVNKEPLWTKVCNEQDEAMINVQINEQKN